MQKTAKPLSSAVFRSVIRFHQAGDRLLVFVTLAAVGC